MSNLSDYNAKYNDLKDVNILPVLYEMLKDIIVKNKTLHMIGYSSDERNKDLDELKEYFANFI